MGGGLAGADAHCQALAEEVGAGDRTWRAYLSTQARPDQPAVNARDRTDDRKHHSHAPLRTARSPVPHSVVSASTGSRAAAARAGKTPATRPISTATASARITYSGAICAGSAGTVT